MTESLVEMLVRHEGLRLRPYIDTTGHVTIGVGRNLSSNGISRTEAVILFNDDLDVAKDALRGLFPEMDSWTEARRNALIDMMFNVGAAGFSGFKEMITAIRIGDWAGAAREMRESMWARQVPKRAEELACMVEKG